MKRVIVLIGILGAMCASMAAANQTVDCGSVVKIKATPKTHYHFVRWDDGNTNAVREVTVDEAKTLTAIFEADDTYSLSLSSNDDALGSVIITAGAKESYFAGDEVTIKATPSDACREFLYWEDDHNNTTPERTITINTTSNSYVAVFKMIQYKLTIQSANATMGSVEFVQ